MINTITLKSLNKTKTALVVSTLFACASAHATIDKLEPPGVMFSNIDAPFKVVVIKNALGTRSIIKGEYEKSLTDLKTTKKPMTNLEVKVSAFETQMGLCVANVKLGHYTTADNACTKAIEYISNTKLDLGRTAYLASLAYSNRGIVKHYMDDRAGAFKDFNTALSLDDNSVVLMNLKALNVATLKKEVLETTTVMNK